MTYVYKINLKQYKNYHISKIMVGFNTRSKEEIAENLDKLREAITAEDEQNAPESSVFAQMLDFHDFFTSKQSGLYFYMRHLDDGSYEFSIAHRMHYRSDSICQLLNSTGMEQGDMEWTISDTNNVLFCCLRLLTRKLSTKNTIFIGFPIQ